MFHTECHGESSTEIRATTLPVKENFERSARESQGCSREFWTNLVVAAWKDLILIDDFFLIVSLLQLFLDTFELCTPFLILACYCDKKGERTWNNETMST